MSDTVQIHRSIAEIRAAVSACKQAGQTVALVPTMGALHAGHIALIEAAKHAADVVVVSIFVNPSQFAAHEDLDTYPRDEGADLAAIASVAPNAMVYAPTAKTMYPDGFQTAVHVGPLADDLCGVSRRQFFGGVATVVAKLFTQVRPDVAIFGEKDYQQLLVVRRMARDLDLAVEVQGAPTVREPDGLALSSRNAYLTAEERALAPQLHVTLQTVSTELRKGTSPATVLANECARLAALGFEIDYLEVRDAETLAPLSVLTEAASTASRLRVFIAAHIGTTRLIDNIAV